MSNSTWLTDYYNRLQSDYQTAFTRRDNVTNWTYSILAGILAIYFGLLSSSSITEPIWRYLLIIGIMVIMIRFFFQSMIAYGFIIRFRYLRNRIEKHWMNGEPTIEKVKEEIIRYDHNRYVPQTGRNRLWNGQLRSGFIINLVMPSFLLFYELYLAKEKLSLEYILPLVVIAVYLVLEVINYATYDQMKKDN